MKKIILAALLALGLTGSGLAAPTPIPNTTKTIVTTSGSYTMNGTIAVQSTSTTATHAFFRLLNAAATQLLAMQQNGNLKIGTGVAAVALDVAGRIRAGTGSSNASPAYQLTDVNAGIFEDGSQGVGLTAGGGHRFGCRSDGTCRSLVPFTIDTSSFTILGPAGSTEVFKAKSASGQSIVVRIESDAAEDSADQWYLTASDGGGFSIANAAESGNGFLITFGSTGDITLAPNAGNVTLTNGDFFMGTTAKSFLQNTSDGADNRCINMGGGGDDDQARGAYLTQCGNEAADPGNFYIVAGNVAGGDIDMITGGSRRFSIDNSGAATFVDTSSVTFRGNIQVGATGGIIRAILHNTDSLNYGAIAAGDHEDLTLTVTGAEDNKADACIVQNQSTLMSTAGLAFTCWSSGANTVTIRATCSDGAGACADPAAATIGAIVIKTQT